MNEGIKIMHNAHHALYHSSQGTSRDVLCDEVQSLVLIKHSDKLQHIWVFQAAHYLHLSYKLKLQTQLPRYQFM